MDPYQDIYNFISDKATNDLTNKYPLYYDYSDIYFHLKLVDNLKLNSNQNSNIKSNDYLKKMYHLAITQFGNIGNFHSDNLTWYKHLNTPSVSNLINYINEILPDVKQPTQWLTEIKNENVSPANYLNSINHHLIISPFISFDTLPTYIIKIIEQLEIIDNLWLEQSNSDIGLITNFNYRSIDIIKFLKNWNNAINQLDFNSKNNKINEITKSKPNPTQIQSKSDVESTVESDVEST